MSDSSPRSRCDAATRRWVERLERFAAGHHTVAAFCTAEGVFLSNFYLLRRRLTGAGSLVWEFVFYATFGLVVTSSVALAGVLLVFSFLIIPAAIGVLYAST